MTIEEALDELIALSDSWQKKGLVATDAFIVLADMLCRFALANGTPIETACQHISTIMQVLHADLTEQVIHFNQPPTDHSEIGLIQFVLPITRKPS